MSKKDQKINIAELTIRPIGIDEAIPYELLLDADPSRQMIDAYLPYSVIYLGFLKDTMIGVYVIMPKDTEVIEIKILAVAEKYQGRGAGFILLQDAISRATQQGYSQVIIGTSNASIGPLFLYQKVGFDLYDIRKNYFVDHYPQPLEENGLPVKHQLLLSKNLR